MERVYELIILLEPQAFNLHFNEENNQKQEILFQIYENFKLAPKQEIQITERF